MDGFSFQRLLRRPWLSLLGFIITGTLCMLLCTLANYRNEQKNNLQTIRETYDVKCVVTDLQGTKSDKLTLSQRYTDFILDEEEGLGRFVGDLFVTKAFNGGNVLGVSSERCDELLDPAMGGGYYAEVEDFFESEESICLVPRERYEELRGSEITLSLTDPAGFWLGKGAGDVTFRVVGWFSGEEKTFIPYRCAWRIGAWLSEHATSDSVAFFLKDNDSAAEVRQAALPLLGPVDPSSEKWGLYALTVQDEQYRATVSAAEQDIARTELLLPLISLLGFGAGLLLGYLGTRGETRNYALMRTLGITPVKLSVTVLLEQQLLPLVACVAVALITGQWGQAALMFICGLVGCIIAALKQILIPPTRLLTAQE